MGKWGSTLASRTAHHTQVCEEPTLLGKPVRTPRAAQPSCSTTYVVTDLLEGGAKKSSCRGPNFILHLGLPRVSAGATYVVVRLIAHHPSCSSCSNLQICLAHRRGAGGWRGCGMTRSRGRGGTSGGLSSTAWGSHRWRLRGWSTNRRSSNSAAARGTTVPNTNAWRPTGRRGGARRMGGTTPPMSLPRQRPPEARRTAPLRWLQQQAPALPQVLPLLLLGPLAPAAAPAAQSLGCHRYPAGPSLRRQQRH